MSTGNELVTLKQVDNYYKDLRKRSAPVIFNNAIGNPAVFSDGADGLPIQSLKVNLLPNQNGSGDASPENIRSIVPWNSIKIFRARKNLFDISVLNNRRGITVEGTTFYGTADAFNSRTREANAIPFFLPKGTTFTVSATAYRSEADSGSGWALYFNYADGTNIRPFYTSNNVITPTEYSGTITAAQDIVSLTFGYFNNALSGIWYVDQMQVEVGTKSTEYEPFVPIAETDIVFPSPIYGGIPDIVRGKMMVTWGIITKNTADMDNNEEYPGWKNTLPRDWVGVINGNIMGSFSNISPRDNGWILGKTNSTDPGTLMLNREKFGKSQSEWIALGIDVQVAIPLITPYEVDIDASVLTSLYGVNTILSDANGDIEVVYRADTGRFLKQNTVKDVQVNGSSVLTDGMANVPLMTTSKPGVAMRGPGLYISNGTLGVNTSSSTDIKGGATGTFTQVSKQHESVFYGLAKLAGVDMAQSSNPVGQFTDEAKVAIQKMLGIYEPPWELIREDGFTKESTGDYVISVDSYGNSFALTDAIMLFELPTNSGRAEKGYYGQIWFYYDNETRYIAPEPGSFSREANADSKAAWFSVRCDNGMVVSQATLSMTNTNSQQIRWRYIQHTNSQADANMGIFINHNFSITKINIKSCLGECHYKLYGKRKWN